MMGEKRKIIGTPPGRFIGTGESIPLDTMAERLLAAQEQERRRIAADLHDDIGQQINAIKFALEGAMLEQNLRERLTSAERACFDKLVLQVGQTVEDLRRIAMNLRPPMLDDLGVICTFEWFCDELRRAVSDIAVTLDISAEEDAIPYAVKVALFRITQEACNNAVKHSKASRLDLYLATDAEGIHLHVHDSGVGFDVEQTLATDTGCGLRSMLERGRLTGGGVRIWSNPGSGTHVLVEWPGSCRE